MQNEIAFYGLGIESGQTKTGLKHSPDFARQTLQSLYNITDLGDVYCGQNYQKFTSPSNFSPIAAIPYVKAYQKISNKLRDKSFVVNWGGDHSIGLSTVSAFRRNYRNGWVVWIDAHADLNIPEVSPSGNLHGMPLALLLGLCSSPNFLEVQGTLDPSKLIYIGIRDLDPFEEQTIRKLKIRNYRMKDIRQIGMDGVVREIKKLLNGEDLHISFDIDSVDPGFAASTGVPVGDGLIPSDLYYLTDSLNKMARVRSVDVTEINPRIGTPGNVVATYDIAFEFLSYFLKSKKKYFTAPLPVFKESEFQL